MSNSILKQIRAYDKEKNELPLREAILNEGHGIPDDKHYNDKENQITVLSYVQGNPPKLDPDGLCHKRYRACLQLEMAQDYDLKVGDEIIIDDAELEITMWKHCFDECKLKISEGFCPLRKGAFFVEVKTPGHIKEGSIVRVKEQ